MGYFSLTIYSIVDHHSMCMLNQSDVSWINGKTKGMHNPLLKLHISNNCTAVNCMLANEERTNMHCYATLFVIC